MKPIPNWPGYFAGEDGRIHSTRPWRGVTALHPLAEGSDKDGYRTVQLAVGGGRTRKQRAHVLIARAYLGPKPSPRHEVRHLNGINIDNVPTNLAWGTAKQNSADREAHGRTARGERNGGGGKLRAEDVDAIRSALAGGSTQRMLADSFGVSPALISHIATGRLWRNA